MDYKPNTNILPLLQSSAIIGVVIVATDILKLDVVLLRTIPILPVGIIPTFPLKSTAYVAAVGVVRNATVYNPVPILFKVQLYEALVVNVVPLIVNVAHAFAVFGDIISVEADILLDVITVADKFLITPSDAEMYDADIECWIIGFI